MQNHEVVAYWERFSMSDSGDFMAALSACLLSPSIQFCLSCLPKFLPYQKPKEVSLFDK